MDEFPSALDDEDGITVSQRRLLLESLKLVFDTLYEEDASGELDLPPTSVATISAQLAAMLEHLTLIRSRGAKALLQSSALDIGSWQRSCAQVRAKPCAGSKRELMSELQECRAKNFDLEKELFVMANASAASARNEKRETEKALQRSFDLNTVLEDKLTSRTQDVAQLSQRISELEHRIVFVQGQVQTKSSKIEELEYELQRMSRMKHDLLLRERKYGKRMLELGVTDMFNKVRDQKRQKNLEKALTGMLLEDVTEKLEFDERDLEHRAQEMLRQVQCEFDEFLEDREHQIGELANSLEDRLRREQDEMMACLEDDMHLPPSVRVSIRRSLVRCKTRAWMDACVQTESESDNRSKDPISRPSPMASSPRPSGVPQRRRRSSLADVTFLHSGRGGLGNASPPRLAEVAEDAGGRGSLELLRSGSTSPSRARRASSGGEIDSSMGFALPASNASSPVSVPAADSSRQGVDEETSKELEDAYKSISDVGSDDEDATASSRPPSSPPPPSPSGKRQSLLLPSPFRSTTATPSTRASSRAESRNSGFSDPRPVAVKPGQWNHRKTVRRSVLDFERTV
jgi:hypothetical protein